MVRKEKLASLLGHRATESRQSRRLRELTGNCSNGLYEIYRTRISLACRQIVLYYFATFVYKPVHNDLDKLCIFSYIIGITATAETYLVNFIALHPAKTNIDVGGGNIQISYNFQFVCILQ